MQRDACDGWGVGGGVGVCMGELGREWGGGGAPAEKLQQLPTNCTQGAAAAGTRPSSLRGEVGLHLKIQQARYANQLCMRAGRRAGSKMRQAEDKPERRLETRRAMYPTSQPARQTTIVVQPIAYARRCRCARAAAAHPPESQDSTSCTRRRGAAWLSARMKRRVWMLRCSPRPCTATMFSCCSRSRGVGPGAVGRVSKGTHHQAQCDS